MEKEKKVYYLANFDYGELKIAIGLAEYSKIKLSKDSWESVAKEDYDKYKRMYEAGVRDLGESVMKALKR